MSSPRLTEHIHTTTAAHPPYFATFILKLLHQSITGNQTLRRGLNRLAHAEKSHSTTVTVPLGELDRITSGVLIVPAPSFAHRFTSRQAQFGTLLFGIGLSLLALAAWDNSSGLPFPMPGIWNSQRSMCLLIALGIAAFGFIVLRNGPRADANEPRSSTWRPTRSGQRFQSLVVYSREGCHLCDEAAELLHHYSAYLPVVQEIDIDAEPALRSKFDRDVPVVEFDGKVRFKGRVSEVLLRRLIEGTPPEGGTSR
jgi:glutaredoxin